MEAEGKSPPKRHTRKRSSTEPQEPRAKRRPAGTAAVAAENTTVASTHPPRQLDDGIASGSVSDGQSSTAGATSAAAVMVHFCGHCQKRFRSPGKLAQHGRVLKGVHTVTAHERTHTMEKSYACSIRPSARRFAQKANVARHERTHTGEQPYACSM